MNNYIFYLLEVIKDRSMITVNIYIEVTTVER